MASRNESERQGLTQSFRSQTGYGTAPLSASTKKNTPRTRKFIQRKIDRTDTLMGIALKYCVTVQELKKENKLWNVDHLFLRTELLIPLTAENEGLVEETDTIVVHDGITAPSFVPSPSSSNSSHNSSSEAAGGLPNGTASSSAAASSSSPSSSSHRNNNNNNNNRNKSNGHPATFSVCAEVEPASSTSSSSRSSKQNQRVSSLNSSQPSSSSSSASAASSKSRLTGRGDDVISASQSSVSGGSTSAADDFFSKYDTNIARLRGDVERMEKNAATLDGLLDSNPLALPPSGMRRQSSTTSGMSRKGSGASISSNSGMAASSGDRRSRAAQLHLDDDDMETASEEASKKRGSSASQSAQESPVLLIRSRSSNKQVKSAIQSLRQADEDLFQL